MDRISTFIWKCLKKIPLSSYAVFLFKSAIHLVGCVSISASKWHNLWCHPMGSHCSCMERSQPSWTHQTLQTQKLSSNPSVTCESNLKKWQRSTESGFSAGPMHASFINPLLCCSAIFTLPGWSFLRGSFLSERQIKSPLSSNIYLTAFTLRCKKN